MGSEVFYILQYIFFGVAFCLGLVFLFSVAMVFLPLLKKEFRASVSIDGDPWVNFAQANNFQFKQTLGNVYEVSGDYRGYHIFLESYQDRYSKSHTRLRLVDTRVERLLEDDLQFPRPVTDVYLLNSLLPGGVPGIIRGKLGCSNNGFEFYYDQLGRESETTYLQEYLDLLCGIADGYSHIMSIGSEAIPVLITLADEREWLRNLLMGLVDSIGRETTRRLETHASQYVCPDCVVYCSSHYVSAQWWRKTTFYGCRNCGQSNRFWEVDGKIVVVLDHESVTTEIEQNGKLYVNWFEHREPFDFAEVVITHASDEDVERFAVKVGNDTDPIRRWKYKEMVCTVSPQNVLLENTMRILQKTFGTVEVKELTERQ